MLRGTRIDRSVWYCMYLNAIYMTVFNVFNYNAFLKTQDLNQSLYYSCASEESWAKSTTWEIE